MVPELSERIARYQQMIRNSAAIRLPASHVSRCTVATYEILELRYLRHRESRYPNPRGACRGTEGLDVPVPRGRRKAKCLRKKLIDAALPLDAMIEIPRQFAGKPPVNRETRSRTDHSKSWRGAQGLAEDVRYSGRWMRDEAEKLGYDVESRDPETGRLHFIEVKGLAPESREVHVTRNEILTGLNKPEDFILALVRVESHEPAEPRYLRGPLDVQIGFTVTGVDFHVGRLLNQATAPA